MSSAAVLKQLAGPAKHLGGNVSPKSAGVKSGSLSGSSKQK